MRHYFFQRYLSPGDTIQAVFHRHFFIVLPNIFFWMAVPVCGAAWGVYRLWYPDILDTSFLWLFETYIGIMFLVILYKILDWYADAWIITEQGIIDVRWSLWTRDMTFTEFHDISAIQSEQNSLFDKLFHIGDVTLHKMGDEMHISRMHQPDQITELVQANLHEHHHETTHAPETNMHIYVDGFRREHTAIPYKNGFRYMPADTHDDGFLDKIRQQPGIIDLSESEKSSVGDDRVDHDDHHGHHGH